MFCDPNPAVPPPPVLGLWGGGFGVKSPWFACAVAWALARDLPGGVAFQGCFFNHRGHRGHRGGAGDFLCLLSTFYFLLSMAGMPLPPHPRPLSPCGGEGRILCFQLSVASLGGFFLRGFAGGLALLSWCFHGSGFSARACAAGRGGSFSAVFPATRAGRPVVGGSGSRQLRPASRKSPAELDLRSHPESGLGRCPWCL